MQNDATGDDLKFLTEMRNMEATGKAMLDLAEYELAQLAILLKIHGVDNAHVCFIPETDAIITLAAEKARIQDPLYAGKTDFALFARYLLMAAFRAALATYEITRRKYDPAYEGDVEGPIGA